MIGSMEEGSTSSSISASNGYGLQAKYKVFLSHCDAQKGFVEQLCVDLERCDRPPFFDKRRDCLPIGEDFPRLIFEAIEQCEVGVVVLSEEFFTSKWPMLELVALANVKKKKPNFIIMPVFLGLSVSQCKDVKNRERWLSMWRGWADGDSRIVYEDWANALGLFGPTNALQYNSKLGEVKYREEIVEAICRLVRPGTRFEDSHIQGRSRLCKVIHERIKQSKVSLLHGVHVIGLHGFGGTGKTTLCKAMCNDLSEECFGKVAHLELGSKSEEELLKEVLWRLTDMNLDRLGAMDVDKYRDRLMQDMRNVKVFLTIDNVSSETRRQALTLLRAKYGHGSVVLVTARSLDELASLRILASECMEMPELEMEEARSLFLYHTPCVPSTYWSNKDDHELVSLCVQRCYFKKGDGFCHYHPLALQALGEQLGGIGYFPERWKVRLDEKDFLNSSGEPQHPVFSILRSSFEALNSDGQLLFMDVALFAPYVESVLRFHNPTKWSVFEWLGMVHGIPVTSVKERLENLKRKSLLENVGNGFDKIAMHDLWREFARLETKADKFEERRWMFECDEHNTSVTNGGHSVNMRRMLFSYEGCKKLEDVSFRCFPGVTVLKLDSPSASLQELELDLGALRNLKSLELDYIITNPYQTKPLISLFRLGSLSKLVFLRWLNIPSSSPCIDEIGRLTNLQVLDLTKCGRVPDLSNLLLLQVACFRSMVSVKTITGFNSNHTNLQFLDLSGSYGLQSCPCVDELVALQELCLSDCYILKEVPNIQKLKQLRKLDVSACWKLQGLPGLGELVSLVELNASFCMRIAELPDMRNLKNLKILNLSSCKCIKSLPSLNELVGLESLHIWGCKNLTQLPDMHNLTNLQILEFNREQSLQSSPGLNDFVSLQGVDVGVDEVHDGLDLCKLTMLKRLTTFGWQGQGFSSLAELVSLEFATIYNCKGVHVLPDLHKLSRLVQLVFMRCEFEDMSGLSHLTSLEILEITKCGKLEALPNLRKLARLEVLRVEHCVRLRDVHGIFGLQNLQRLRSSGDVFLHENLELDHPRSMKRLRPYGDVFLHENLELDHPQSVKRLRPCGDVFLHENLELDHPRSMKMLRPCGDAGLHVNLELDLPRPMTRLQSSRDVNLDENLAPNVPQPIIPSILFEHARQFEDQQEQPTCSQLCTLVFKRCPIEELPDLAHIPKLSFLNVSDCVDLTNLTCTRPLSPAIKHLNVSGCTRLQALPDLTNSRKMEFLNVAKSSVVLSAQLIQDMKVRFPSIHLKS